MRAFACHLFGVILLLNVDFFKFYLFIGSMICIGRSNYFRFNHPEEAERMKTILPNAARISSVPMHFQQHNGHGHH